ncbi:MAG: DUF2065 domain-containing protein [Woeseia sp.]
MWQDVFTAFALYMVIEGMIPFIGPDRFRQAVVQIAKLNDNHLRVTGLTVMVAGLVLLFIVR